jgi:hypothetical protein
MTAVRHANYRDYWVVALRVNASNVGTIYVWKVDLAGVHTAAVGSYGTGLTYSAGWRSYMRFSKDGTRFWQGNALNPGGYVMANFDPATGTFSNIKTKAAPANGGSGVYGAEFSPSGQYVYATHIGASNNAVYESDLFIYDFDALMATASGGTATALKRIYYSGSQVPGTIIDDLTANCIGAVLTGPGGRMYVSNAFTNSMFVIPNPDYPANLQLYKLNHILDVGRTNPNVRVSDSRNAWGLPVYAAMHFQLTVELSAGVACEKTEANFQVSVVGGEGSEVFDHCTVDWGDGTDNVTVTKDNLPLNSVYTLPHTYDKVGDYTATFTSYDSGTNVIAESSGTTPVHVSNCLLPVNPNVRGRIK